MINGSQTTSGAKVRLNIDGKDIAYATNVSFTINHNVQPIEVIGDHRIKEHLELGVTVEFSCSMFRVNKKAAIALGLSPTIESFLQQPSLTATIINTAVINDPQQPSLSESTFITLMGLKMVSRSGSVDARGAFTETLNFVGTLYSESDK